MGWVRLYVEFLMGKWKIPLVLDSDVGSARMFAFP